MYEKILIPLDRSKSAEMVLPYALEFMAKFASEIHIVIVSESGSEDHSYNDYLDQVKSTLNNDARNFGIKEDIEIQTRILSGKPANEIIRYAEEINTNLVLMASHGASSDGLWLLGNVAAKIIRATNRPVLLVRAPAGQDKIKKGELMKKILIPLDGSKLGEAAVPLARAIAEHLGSEIILFNVDEPAVSWGMYEGYAGYTNPPPDPESRNERAMEYLDHLAKPLRESGLAISNVVVFGLPARQISDYAKTNDVDLIAMSTHGRSGIAEWVFGSVTDKVLHSGDKPVLVVRPPKL